MRPFGLIVVAALLVAGCATAPPLPPIDSARGDAVGLLVDLGPGPTHTHIGTTIFANFEKPYDYRWDLDAEVEQAMRGALEGAGFTVVDLEDRGFTAASLRGLVVAEGDQWQVGADRQTTLQRLRDELRLKAVVVVAEGRVLVELNCGAYGCSEHYADAPGLFSRSFMGWDRFYAVPAFAWGFFVLEPLADLRLAEPLRSMLRLPVVPLEDFAEPDDFQNLDEARFAPVRAAIVEFAAAVATQGANGLNPR